ncbi:septum formation initiator family protein [Bacillus sp. CGMCC 1.16541]|uniref:FtsB family cell division protein n=1 Tax=Bacillus sp. CGMCC 1.16541 TaxID=2185143 RepID=UPI000D73B6E1|nr:septum formation initiator family protein [Bacillus sp. CGMCC 1.16541]
MSAIKDEKVTKLNSDYITEQELKKKNVHSRRVGLVRRLTVFGILALVVSIAMISTIITQASTIEDKKLEEEKLEQQLTKLETKQKQLEDEIVKLNDEEYIKKIARRDYFLSEEGEIIFNIKND